MKIMNVDERCVGIHTTTTRTQFNVNMVSCIFEFGGGAIPIDENAK